MKRIKGLVAAASVMALAGTLLASPAFALGTPKPQQKVTWGWEDGADKSHRDFAEEDYDTVQDMPALQVTVSPASVGRQVILDTYDDYSQSWTQALKTRTDATGTAKFHVDPSCNVGDPSWCDHDLKYRIRVLKSGTQKALVSSSFVVTFVAVEEASM
jgi:hypothetical protein